MVFISYPCRLLANKALSGASHAKWTKKRTRQNKELKELRQSKAQTAIKVAIKQMQIKSESLSRTEK